MKNKIGWCNMTWNPVWGCLNNCEYCYARKIAKRFRLTMAIKETVYRVEKGQVKSSELLIEGDKVRDNLGNFNPIFLYSQFNKEFPKKPQRIFVGSMSEIYYWEKRWIRDTLNKILEYPQHTFQFLTKFPDIYSQWYFHPNCWIGITITKEENFIKGIPYDFICSNNITFLSIEPILEKIDPNLLNELNINWVIIGAETGNRKGRVIPKKEWIEDIVSYCRDKDIPVYLKYSLKEIYPEEIKEFPKGGKIK